MRPRPTLLIWALGLLGLGSGSNGLAKDIIGWVERVRLEPEGLELHAKIDTGADTSSLHARRIREFEKKGKLWVRFQLRNEDDEEITVERRVLRTANIKRHFGDTQERPVIKVGLCLGAHYKSVEVTLVDRTGFDYQLLVGRNFLEGDFLVDTSLRYAAKPECETETPG